MKRRVATILPKPDHVVFVADALPTCGRWLDPRSGTRYSRSGKLLRDRGSGRGGWISAAMAQAGTWWDRVEQWAFERRLKHISVRSNVARKESHRFYERVGYARVKTQHAYRKHIR